MNLDQVEQTEQWEQPETEQNSLVLRVQDAKADKQVMNTLLREYMPFIRKCVANVFFKGQSKADNLTEAMLAFAHSVQTYESAQGAFIPYAAVVIRNRLIDSARRELSLQKRFLPFSAGNDKGEIAGALDWEVNASLQSYDRSEEEENLRLEIEAVNAEFAEWGFSWSALLKKCPKQDRSRRIAFRAAQVVLGDPALLSSALSRRQLPLVRLAETFPRKALEKYRHYIAAVIILSQGNYPYVYSFVPQPFFEEEQE